MKRRTIEHYEFIRKIGAGGSGVVFLATDTLLQRPVVLKLLKRSKLKKKAVVTVAVTQPGYIGKVARYTLGKNKLKKEILCLEPGASKPQATCS